MTYNDNCHFEPLSFGVVCCTAVDNQKVHREKADGQMEVQSPREVLAPRAALVSKISSPQQSHIYLQNNICFFYLKQLEICFPYNLIKQTNYNPTGKRLK